MDVERTEAVLSPFLCDKKKEECGICGKQHKIENCTLINGTIEHVKDSPTPSYAQLTLPEGIELKSLVERKSVFATKLFAKGVKFGPFIAKTSALLDVRIEFPIKIILNEEESVYLETYEEKFCNWMCFVNPAHSNEEQNLLCYQDKRNIYFSSLRDIKKGEELKVGYAPHYAKTIEATDFITRSCHVYENTFKSLNNDTDVLDEPNELQSKIRKTSNRTMVNKNETILPIDLLPGNLLGAREQRGQWSCKQCAEVFVSVAAYARHLRNHLKPPTKCFPCPYCWRNFTRDGYNRKIHVESCKSKPLNTGKETNKKLALTKSTNEIKNNSWNEEKLPGLNSNRIDSEPHLTSVILDFTHDLDFEDIINDECLVEKPTLNMKNNRNVDFGFEFGPTSGNESHVPNIDPSTFHEKTSFLPISFTSNFDVSEEEKNRIVEHFLLEAGDKLSEPGAADSCRMENPECRFNPGKENMKTENTKKRNMPQRGGDFRCDICNKCFQTQMYLYRHLRKHTGEFTCNICYKVFSRNENFILHREKCKPEGYSKQNNDNGGNKLLCRHPRSLHDHIKNHSCQGLTMADRRSHLCQYCGVMFPHNNSLYHHIQRKHYDKRFECSVCKKMFSTKSTMTEHQLLHSEKKWECKGCFKRYSTKRALSSHTKNNEKLCAYCDKIFVCKSGLKDHMKIHMPTPTFECILCRKKFNNKMQMERHFQKTHLDVTLYGCPHCSKWYPRRSDLNRHIRTVHKERYKCTFCDTVISYRQSLEKHLLLKHKDRIDDWNCPDALSSMRYRIKVVSIDEEEGGKTVNHTDCSHIKEDPRKTTDNKQETICITSNTQQSSGFDPASVTNNNSEVLERSSDVEIDVETISVPENENKSPTQLAALNVGHVSDSGNSKVFTLEMEEAVVSLSLLETLQIPTRQEAVNLPGNELSINLDNIEVASIENGVANVTPCSTSGGCQTVLAEEQTTVDCLTLNNMEETQGYNTLVVPGGFFVQPNMAFGDNVIFYIPEENPSAERLT